MTKFLVLQTEDNVANENSIASELPKTSPVESYRKKRRHRRRRGGRRCKH